MRNETSKNAAHEFLGNLKRAIDENLPTLSEVRKHIEKTVREAKSGDKRQSHLRIAESAFVNEYVMRPLFEQMQLQTGTEQARSSLLSESWRNMREFCLASPARSQRHPFGKVIGARPPAIMKQWKGQAGAPLRQACPDFAVTHPFPKIVFEAKYFPKGDLEAAETALVTGIYEAFFYRALPFVPPDKARPSWDYDFACLLAYDGSEKGSLMSAWNSLSDVIQTCLWEGAGVYVMIVRDGRSSKPGSTL